MEKATIELDQDDWHSHSTESVWLSEVSAGKYRVENIPFFARGLSFRDIVSVREIDGQLVITKRLRSGKGSTYRIIPAKGGSKNVLNQFLTALNEAGCAYEHGDFGFDLYALNVPAGVDVHKVYALLEDGEQSKVWDFEEGDCSHDI
ncbi:DUF4265 domain-containing protein [Leisingera sp. ANG-S3]|uniref:DUF4265 domain-containing protein n=1 Tax=Leisingera sp. ANG-S3 TaxID=1577899 RepID=UPI0005805560|nr:DUF4265 domain-containing protein [Leisingera sp. ANG-S3]KIC25474.1 hypothetical protein RA23_06325 [Leisingera sp. ANG-S3]